LSKNQQLKMVDAQILDQTRQTRHSLLCSEMTNCNTPHLQNIGATSNDIL